MRRWINVALAPVLAGLLMLGAGCARPVEPRKIPVPITTSPRCPDGGPVVDLALPDDRSEVRVRVLNATGVAGVGPQIAAELAEWGYEVVDTQDSYPGDYPEVAVLVHGPRAVGKAWLVRANFLPPVRLEFDAERDDDTVDVILGRDFANLLTRTEVNQMLASYGQPTAPPGACGVESTED